MVLWCCSKKADFVPTLTDQLTEKLRSIENHYKNTHYACLMEADGKVCAALPGNASESNVT